MERKLERTRHTHPFLPLFEIIRKWFFGSVNTSLAVISRQIYWPLCLLTLLEINLFITQRERIIICLVVGCSLHKTFGLLKLHVIIRIYCVPFHVVGFSGYYSRLRVLQSFVSRLLRHAQFDYIFVPSLIAFRNNLFPYLYMYNYRCLLHTCIYRKHSIFYINVYCFH